MHLKLRRFPASAVRANRGCYRLWASKIAVTVNEVGPKDVRELDIHLRRIGNNLNQFAARANEDRLKGQRFRSDAVLNDCPDGVKEAIGRVNGVWNEQRRSNDRSN